MAERAPRAELPLDCTGVRFAPDFAARLERLALALSAAAERRAAAGGARLAGGAEEFIGLRPYRAGEDVRALDLASYVRLRKPYVRVARQEARESWAVLLDCSRSMGVGRPGKLQLAAELAAAVGALALRRGASLRVWAAPGPRSFALERRAQLVPLLRWLGGLAPTPDAGLGALLEARVARGAARVFLIGDFLDLDLGALDATRPSAGATAHAHLPRARGALRIAHVLAPIELDPASAVARGESAVWLEPESGARRTIALEPGAHAAYERALASWLAQCEAHARRRGAHWTLASSAHDFERAARALCEGAA